MLFNVPQYIDVEDKIAGPLTAKQLLWMFGMGAVLLVMWNIFEPATFFISSVPVVLIFVAFAFYRPYNQPLITFITNAILFLIRPKIYVWSRSGQVSKKAVQPKIVETSVSSQKNITLDEIQKITRIVDNHQ